MTTAPHPNILPPSCPPRCLSRAQAAEYIGVAVTLFDAMVHDRRMPKPLRFNCRTVWDRLQLDEAVNVLRDAAESTTDSWSDFQ